MLRVLLALLKRCRCLMLTCMLRFLYTDLQRTYAYNLIAYKHFTGEVPAAKSQQPHALGARKR